MEETTEIRDTRGKAIVLPNKDVGDWNDFWSRENIKIKELIKEGKLDPDTRTWYAYIDTAERGFKNVLVPGEGVLSGYVTVTKGGHKRPGSDILSSQYYFADIETEQPVTEQIRKNIAQSVLPGVFFQTTKK